MILVSFRGFFTAEDAERNMSLRGRVSARSNLPLRQKGSARVLAGDCFASLRSARNDNR